MVRRELRLVHDDAVFPGLRPEQWDRVLDVSVNGFFNVTQTNGDVAYSRAGAFKLDKEGFLVTNSGAQLNGFQVDPATGTILRGAQPSPLQLPTAKGLPAKPWGRIEVVYAPSNPKRIYAFIENVRSALYVSDDGGATWTAIDGGGFPTGIPVNLKMTSPPIVVHRVEVGPLASPFEAQVLIRSIRASRMGFAEEPLRISPGKPR